MEDMYNRIYDFCRIKNLGGAHKNGNSMSPRIIWIIKFLQELQIDFKIDEFSITRFGHNKFYNIYLPGTSRIAITAHHDIVNPNSDNANDNSASVINAILLKKLDPNVQVILLDGEEPPMMGVGSDRASQMIKSGIYSGIDSVLNLELTGRGGKNFFIGDTGGVLSRRIINIFNPPEVSTPFNDSDIFRDNGIDSIVINPLPNNPDGSGMDFSLLYNCHSLRDSLSTIDIGDMREFVEDVLQKIVSND